MANLIDNDAKVYTPGQFGYGHPTVMEFPSKEVDTSDTVLLLNLNGSDGATSTTDSSPRAHSISFGGNAQIDTAQSKFGASACLFDGSGDYLNSPASNDWRIGEGLFTVDFWVKHANLNKTQRYITHFYDTNNYWALWISNTNVLTFTLRSGGAWRINTAGGTISDTNWHHVALCKNGNDWGIYLDGAQTMYVSSPYNSYEFSLTGSLYIGALHSTSADMDGWLEDVRICHSNPFGAFPNSGKLDTITVPTSEHTTNLVTTKRIFSGFINDLGNLEIHKSFTDGSSWVLDRTIVPSVGSIVYFNLGYRQDGSNDELFVLYNDGTAKYYVEKRAEIGSWNQVLDLTTNSYKALLRWDNNIDRLQVIYSNTSNQIRTKYSDDGGSSWSDGTGYNTPYIVDDFDISPIDNSIWISYGRSSGSNSAGVLQLSSIGTYISDPTTYGDNASWNKYGNILINSSGSIFRVLYDSSVTRIEMWGIGGTQNWSSLTIDNLIAAMDGNDNIYVFYTKTSDNKVYYRKYDGSWGSETLLVNTANNKFNCQKHSIPSSITLNYMYYTA